ncbi:DNA topoisomerase I [candidate division WWE3 bacterium CG22_combo_CG10-13_8_21_14_all_39_12]|uniref:DNA topoisomerase 1 n=1 Tax=candidate division WWE3 bacterium CG22_combo_CG10-13_8_21_14_all_39_12 TaxID=1975094 RepID=A0A2H0BHA4_UNCKA|nr:MAG: DNA topoisomerase I [candidate division WWE3 bacterium CG22_combo_CG10-13_8_21_14_all_39_12]
MAATKKGSTTKKAKKATAKKTVTVKNLVIVESPSKTASIGKYLGADYFVTSSKGHIIDLPKSDLGIDTEHNYKPEYTAMRGKKKVIDELRKDAKHAQMIYLATDLDREGEAIGWHIASALGGLDDNGKLKKDAPIKRVVFSEITKDAILEAFKNPRELNYNLIDAYQARRVLDRLVGYKLSPLLWRKIQYGLSAGRVQSVAVRLIVERENERKAFTQTPYYRITAQLKHENIDFTADLTHIDDIKIEEKESITLFAGDYSYSKTTLDTPEKAKVHLLALKTTDLTVQSVESKASKKSPSAPFTTASLQRAAQTFLYMTAKSTMRNAQRLYEEGHISYHRTDSTNLSEAFVTQARDYIKKTYGDKYIPAKPIEYTDKKKRSQEAHEAIRPTHIEDWEQTKKSIAIHLGEKEANLYDLITRRALASQATQAQYHNTTIILTAKPNDHTYTFRARGSVIAFDGFLAITLSMGEDSILPQLTEGQKITPTSYELSDHETSPPPRYSEASLIHALEEHEIGRPSTYAPIIDTIQNRQYVIKEKNAFVPEDIGFAVTKLLVEHFPRVTDLDFTADMEQQMDDIVDGDREWEKIIDDFYKPFEVKLEQAEKEIERDDYKVLENLDEKCPDCGKHIQMKLGRYGKFYSCSGFPDCKYARPFVEKIGMNCPACKNGDVIVRRTRFGKKFFGCTNYPDCDWAEWKDPRREKEDDE